jgi:hypothetical protein
MAATRNDMDRKGEKMGEKTIMDMFADMGNQFNLPKIDYDALLDTRRKDIDAVQKSLLVLSQGRAFIARQQEVFADMIRQSRELIDEFKPRGSPAEIAAKQTDLATRTFEAGRQEHQGHRRVGTEVGRRGVDDHHEPNARKHREARAMFGPPDLVGYGVDDRLGGPWLGCPPVGNLRSVDVPRSRANDASLDKVAPRAGCFR